MKEVKIDTEYVKLQQIIKMIGLVSSGSEAKYMIIEGKVKVNNSIATERGKKIRKGDIVEVEGVEYKVISSL